MIFLLVAALLVQAVGFGFLHSVAERRHSQERRFLINHALSGTPNEFAIMASASRPDETVVDIAEARTPRASTPAPLGL